MKPVRKGIFAIAALSFALGLPSCSDENPWSGTKGLGGIRLTLAPSPDYVEGAPSTRATESLFTIPDASEFSLKLEKLDGSYSKEWPSITEFEKEEGFPVGAYSLTAYYGSIEDEGFEKPYFYGSEQLTVLEERENAVELEAILSNTLVSIEYTDAFRNYFSSWNAEVHSAGHSYNAVPGDEIRPVFVAPGSLDIAVEFTDAQNRTAKIQAANFEALARHHYHVTIDVNNGNVGAAQLVISFDETVDEENIYIDLTDELFTTPVPSLSSEGFTSGDIIELLEGTSSGSDLKLNAIARAGISSAVLTLASETFTPAFGKEIDLCTATPAQQEQLSALGVNVTGLYKNPGVFAVVDITSLPSALPSGRHTLSLIVKDKFSRVSDPVTLTFDSEAVNLEISPEPSIFGSNEAVVNVAFNGGDPTSDLSFKAMDGYGSYVDVPVKSTVKQVRSRALPINNWIVTIALPETDRNPIPVKAYFKGIEKSSFDVDVVVPSFSYEVDPFAGKALVKVTADDPKMQTAIINSVQPVLSGPAASSVTMTRNRENGILTLSGLSPASSYSLSLTLGNFKSDAESFTTETALDVPNGNFSETSTLAFSDIQVGGQYKVLGPTYSMKSSINRQVPNGWATLNDLTCWGESSNKNTWFMVPSTYVENKNAVIRSVGYHHNGTTPSTSSGATTYYCTNAPSQLERSAGELFLGEYSFIGGRTNGISFSSRPSSLSFDYTYSSYNSEEGEVYIAVIGNDGKILTSKTESLFAATSMIAKTISLGEYSFGTKASRLEVRFRSTKGNEIALQIPSGSDLNEHVTLVNRTKDANQYAAFASGSVLKIANVKLNY